MERWRPLKLGLLQKSFARGKKLYCEYTFSLVAMLKSIQIPLAIATYVDSMVENVDVSEMVSGHLRYQFVVGSILKKIGWEDIDIEEVSRAEETLELLEKQEQSEIKDNEKTSDFGPLTENRV